MTSDLKSIARNGVLRVAINTGNRALVQADDSKLGGISPALAQRLTDEIGAMFQAVVYGGAGKVFNDADNDVWDVGFLAIDAERARRIAFTRPYISIEAAYAVRATSSFQSVCDVDSAGTSVLTSTGSAYDMHLTSTLRHAILERSGTPPESFEDFRNGRCDAVAGVRASLETAFGGDPNIRILTGVLTAVHQAMVLPGADNPAISALDDFVARAISDEFVASYLAHQT